MPASTSRSSTRPENTRPCDASRLRSIRAGVDLEPLDQPAGAVEHVVEGDRGVGQDDALGRGVGDVALVPERDVLEADERVARAASRARPQMRSHTIGFRLCGIAEDPFWPAANGSNASRTSVRWRWRISSANRSSDGADAGDRAQQRGVPVAGDDLRRDRLAVEAERLQGELLDARVGVGVGAHGARELADADAGEGAASSRARPRRSSHQPPEQLQAERRRLGVHAVGAADHRRVAVLLGARRSAASTRVDARRAGSGPRRRSCSASAVSTTSDDVRP